MGTQGLGGRALLGRRGGARAKWSRVAIFGMSCAILPLAAGCSSSSLPSFGSSAPQAAAVPPPPNAYGQAAGQPAYAPPPARPGYPQQAQGGNPQPASYAPAAAPATQPPPSSDGTIGSVTSSYTSFLKAFRDPEPDPDAARASVYPQRSLADMFKGSDSNQRPDPASAGYPQQALVPAGAAGASPPPQQNAYVPHPPSTYTPSGQPYTPPPGQSGYAPPPATPQNYVAPPANPPRSGQQSSAKPPSQQTAAARSKQKNPPAQTANNAPAPVAAPPVAAAPPPPAENRDYSDSLPYPKQSLTDVFSGSSESQPQSVPRPPSTYAPQGQAAYGAPAAAAAPPPADPASSGPYPKQSLFEVFSNNK
jgi:hypothetical protein